MIGLCSFGFLDGKEICVDWFIEVVVLLIFAHEFCLIIQNGCIFVFIHTIARFHKSLYLVDGRAVVNLPYLFQRLSCWSNHSCEPAGCIIIVIMS